MLHRYRKIHPFSYSGEHERYQAGDVFLSLDVDGVRCSFFVCYDLRFADEFWQLAPGTDCYVVPANWPAARREHWRALLLARAIENQAYVVGVNRVGRGGRLDYAGDSMIVGPFGELLADGAHAGESVLVADVDPAHVTSVCAEFPFLADRRVPLASPPMCGCLVAIAAMLSPRLAVFLVWLFTDRMSIAFDSFWWASSAGSSSRGPRWRGRWRARRAGRHRLRVVRRDLRLRRRPHDPHRLRPGLP